MNQAPPKSPKRPVHERNKPVTIRAARISNLAVRARVQLDLFNALAHNIDEPAHPHIWVLREYGGYWAWARGAHERDFIVRITNLFHERKDTDNIPHHLLELIEAGKMSPAQQSAIQAKIKCIMPIKDRLTEIRNKAVAHQDTDKLPPEIYKANPVNFPDLYAISDAALEISSELCRVVGIAPIPPYDQATAQLDVMLRSLAPSNQRDWLDRSSED
jgi:hypothetical protein